MTIAGIFIGGAATRFGGAAKGLLPAPDGSGSVVGRLVQILGDLQIPCIFVGTDHRMETVGLPHIIDGDQRGEKLGPIGGFLALYDHALNVSRDPGGAEADAPGRAAGGARVVALACDMPFITRASIARLVACPAPLAAARRDGRWEPFFSIHDPRVMRPRAEALIASGKRSLQALFESSPEGGTERRPEGGTERGTGWPLTGSTEGRTEAVAIDVPPHELDDWDSPEDRARSTR